jgi:AraC-like DNA-binding protein
VEESARGFRSKSSKLRQSPAEGQNLHGCPPLAEILMNVTESACRTPRNVVVLLHSDESRLFNTLGRFRNLKKKQGDGVVNEGVDPDWFGSRLAECLAAAGGQADGTAFAKNLSDQPISVAPLIAATAARKPAPLRAGADARKRTLGILGMGKMGEAIAQRAHQQLGASILYSSAARVPALESTLAAAHVPIDRLLADSDVICIVMPAEYGMSNLIGPREVEAVVPNKLFVARRRCAGIDRALMYLSTNYADRLHVRDLAAMAGFSDSHFQHQFAALLGITPHRYQLMLRIFHAMEHLRRGMAIRDVAQSVGFADQSHLHRYFRRIVGVSPGLYQRRFKVRPEAR